MMRKVLLIVLLAVIHASNIFAQVRIANDTLYVYETPYATYGVGDNVNQELTVDVLMLGQRLLSEVKVEFEKLVRADFASKSYLQAKRIHFEYRMLGETPLANSALIEAGELIQDAGAQYNAAIALNFLATSGGYILVYQGFPVAGVIVTLGGNLIAFVVHVSANFKLGKGGKRLTGKI
jgi:hypothetical protein